MVSPHLWAENFSMKLIRIQELGLRKVALKWMRFGHRNAIEKIVSCGESAEWKMAGQLNVAGTVIIFRNNLMD
jgi:hypothetical protein